MKTLTQKIKLIIEQQGGISNCCLAKIFDSCGEIPRSIVRARVAELRWRERNE
jgi:hypothetical protein